MPEKKKEAGKPGMVRPGARKESPASESKQEGASQATDSTSGPRNSAAEQGRWESLRQMLMAKRQEILAEIKGGMWQSLTEDQQRRLEAAMDVGDQSLMDLQRELGISLLEMRNRKRQLIDEALVRLSEGTYGVCAECGIEISEKRLAAVPFARFCVECQAQQELMEKIEKGEERD